MNRALLILLCALAGCGPASRPCPGFWGPLDPACGEWTLTSSPAPSAQALEGDAGACGAAATDDTCVACAKASCCTESLSCLGDAACACLVSCRTAGETVESCSAQAQCDLAPGATYTTMASCAAAHCAEQCPRLQ
jgi:hypothetical protein